MIRIIVLLVAAVLCAVPVEYAFAHAVYMSVNDNGDGSVTVGAAFSTGGAAPHADVRLEDDTGRILWQGSTDDAGNATFPKPDVPYLIILESDKGHSVEEDGPP